MLLFRAGNFLQVPEGERVAVLALYKKIAQDSRHDRITTVFQGVAPERDFPYWSMGFHDLDALTPFAFPASAISSVHRSRLPILWRRSARQKTVAAV
jgi:hypothetical protein